MSDFGSGDFSARLQGLLEVMGAPALGLLALLGGFCVLYTLQRGVGLSLLLLLISYSLIFVQQGGVSAGAFFLRVLSLALLSLGVIRRLVIPGAAFYALLAYAMMGIIFSTGSYNLVWSIQNGGLLLLAVVSIPLGVASYLDSYRSVRSFLHLFVVAGGVWTILSLSFLGDFVSSSTLRFAGGGEINATGYSRTGALLFPFMLWAAMQRGSAVWRLIGIGGATCIPICLFLSATKTALVMAAISTVPLLLRQGAGKTMRIVVLFGVLGVVTFFLGSYLLGSRSTEFIVTRLMDLSLSGREHRWSVGLEACLSSPFFGHGAGASALYSMRSGIIFHSAYLAIWYNTGIFGLILFSSAPISQAVGAMKLIRRAGDPMARDAMRLALGVLLSLLALGLVENSFASASKFGIAMLLMMVTLVARVRQLDQRERGELGRSRDALLLATPRTVDPLSYQGASGRWRL